MDRSKSQLPTTFSFPNRHVSNNHDNTEGFNNYFTNVADSLAELIQETQVSFKDFLPAPS